MTALEEIKKALEGATLYPGPWEVGELIKRRPYSDAWELQNATDLFGYIYCGHEAPEDVKPVVEYIAAVNPVAITELVSTLESLQRENEALKKDRDFWKEQFQVETRYRIELADRGTLLALTDANSRAETAEAEVKRLQAEIDRKSSMPGDHRYWEGRYRDEAAENEKLREVLRNFTDGRDISYVAALEVARNSIDGGEK
ncbi:hypothetical protein [Agrobacterium pusense]|uniref:hypothetical protein n=1 Tax=Agrobacterium pusense TaxID=648995 RepID=UPI000D19C147|nr:hypothetical protein [Agrobacterium pusense]